MKAIEVKNLIKNFTINHHKHSTLKDSLIRGFKSAKETLVVLDNISFDVKPGEFLGIIGSNGCGKSTLLKILANIYSPTSGSIKINGRVSPFLELGVGFQQELTAFENIFLYGTLLGLSEKKIYQKLEEIIAYAELAKFIDTPIKNFSSGMVVRLAFSIAIQAEFDILLLDEVLAVGDIDFQRKCQETFINFKKNHKTIIFVSHDLKAITEFCDRCLWLEQGKIFMDDRSDQVVRDYQNFKNISKPDNLICDTSKTEKKSVKIKQTRIVQSGRETKQLSTGDSFEIEIDYELSNHLPKINFGIGIYKKQENIYCFNANTLSDQIAISPSSPSSSSKIILKINDLPLLPGEYYFNLVCFGEDEKENYCFLSAANSFVIKNDRHQRGVVAINHSWKTK